MFSCEPFDVEFAGDDNFDAEFYERDDNFDAEFYEGDDLDVEFGEIQSSSGVLTRWSQLLEKPFERIGETLAVRDGTLDVNIHEVHNDAGGLTTVVG